MLNTKTFQLTLILLFLASCSLDNSSYYPSYSEYGFGDQVGGDMYNQIIENPFVLVSEEPTSTFSIDADGASYANVRRYLHQDQTLPPADAIRTEELINYFQLDYHFSEMEHPIALNGEVSTCPWADDHKLIRVGIKGKPIPKVALPPSNFVFLIDVSGSMGSGDKLDLLKEGFKLLTDELSDQDRIAIVTYAGSAGVVLESTPGNEKSRIKKAINKLGSGGSTAGAKGILTAYEIAEENFIENGNNRIVIGTDGDFNVGPSSQEALIDLIEEKRESGVYVTVLGVGRGNLNDGALEQIADNGNGTYEYIDNLEQLKKVFIYDYNKFYAVAKDVKIQVTFDPNLVESYRLIGYENRVLNNEDFEDDKKDAGEIGSNQNITALYEIVPLAGANYQSGPTFNINFRYKLPDSDSSIPMELSIMDLGKSFDQSSDFMKFTASVASFALVLRNSEYKGNADYASIISWLEGVDLYDQYGFKEEFATLIEEAQKLLKEEHY
jgi:Ca-activated chloride channel family protein